MIKRIITYISQHFFLRNTVLAVCAIIVFLSLVSFMLGLFTRHGERLIVPDLSGLTIDQATEICSDHDMQAEIVDSLYVPKEVPGAVLDQSPEPNMTVKAGRKIFLVINAQHPRMDVIPYVAGFSLRQAKNMLENRGFEIAKIVYTSDLATNNVLQQSYNGTPIKQGSKVKAELGEGITLTVGRNDGAPLPLVPKIIGLSLREAKSRIWEMGLNVGEIKTDATTKDKDILGAKVYRQMPNQQMRATFGAPVTIYLTTDMSKVTSGSKTSDADARKFVDMDSTETSEQFLTEVGLM